MRMQCEVLRNDPTSLDLGRESCEGPDGNPDLEPELSGPITLLLVEEDQLLATLLQDILNAEPDFELLATVGKVAEAQAGVQEHQPCVLLLDLGFPDEPGIRP
ncbi:MAG: response regulator, partial [Armatimonadetes bacterium]|nr:response regulator [Armatimonadota bacterium]